MNLLIIENTGSVNINVYNTYPSLSWSLTEVGLTALIKLTALALPCNGNSITLNTHNVARIANSYAV